MALPFDPRSISSLILWLDASDRNSLVTNGNSVIQWRDKTIFQNHTAFSSTTSPILSSINTLSSIYFNSRSGNPQFFQGPLSTNQSTFTGYTSSLYIFAVATMVSTPVRNFNRNFIQIGSNSTLMDGLINYQLYSAVSSLAVFPLLNIADLTNFYFNVAQSNTLTSAFLYDGCAISNVPAFNRPFQTAMGIVRNSVIGCNFNLLSINGSYFKTNWYGGTYTVPAASRYSIGGNLLGAADARSCWDGHIGEVLIYNTTPPVTFLTNDQIQSIQGYLATKWGLQNDLMNSHPYKANIVSLSTINSAVSANVGTNSKLFTLPSSGTIQNNMIWLQGNNNYLSTATFSPQLFETINYQNGTSVQLNAQSQNVNLVNNGNSNWTLLSRYEGDMSNVGFNQYTYFPGVSTLGTAVASLGYAVGVNSNSTYLVATQPASNFGGITGAGAAIVYKKNILSDTWSIVNVFGASDRAATDRFGSAVSMSYDANYILVGSASNNISGISDVGATYMFKKDPVSDIWNQLQKITVSDIQRGTNIGDRNAITMNQNANYIALGSPNFSTSTALTNTGTVYMFSKDATTDYWNQVQQITLPFPTAGAFFGSAVAMSADGSYLVIGANSYEFLSVTAGSGTAFVYKKDTNSDIWNYVQGLQRNDPPWVRDLGYSVSISGNANYIVTTGYDSIFSGAYIYKKRETTDYYDRLQFVYPASLARLGDFFGYTSAINYDGTYVAISENSNGNIFLYKKQTTTDWWVQYPNTTFTGGASVTLDSNGENIYIGTGGGYTVSGRVFPYKQSTMTVINASNTFLNVNTIAQKGTLLLPPASAVPGEMFWIKDTGNNALNNVVSISTPLNTYLMSNYNAMFFYQNNFSAQFQSDGISNYNLVNYYNGGYTSISNSVNFVPFRIIRSSTRPTLLSTSIINLDISIGTTFTTSGNALIIPANTINSFDNIYFKSFDNQTLLPFFRDPMSLAGRATTNTSNTFFVRIPYISFDGPTYYVYWDSNYIAKPNGFSTFDFFDDFSYAPGGQPDPNKWITSLKGGGTPSVSQTSDGFMLLKGSDNQNASANLITRFPFARGFGSVSNIYTYNNVGFITSNNNFFYVRLGYFCTDTIGTVISVGSESNIQDNLGGQTNWDITTLTEGATYYSSTLTRHFGFDTNPGVPMTVRTSNITTSYGPSNEWNVFMNLWGRIYENNNTTTFLLSNDPPNQRSSFFLHIGQTSKVGFTAPQLYLAYVAAYQNDCGFRFGNLNDPLFT